MINRNCIDCGREFKTATGAQGKCIRCVMKAWRGRNKERIKQSRRSPANDPRTYKIQITRFMTSFEVFERAINQCGADKRGGYKWQ